MSDNYHHVCIMSNINIVINEYDHKRYRKKVYYTVALTLQGTYLTHTQQGVWTYRSLKIGIS